jgi:hypothetical protein
VVVRNHRGSELRLRTEAPGSEEITDPAEALSLLLRRHFFSDLEARIVLTLGAGPLPAAVIAKRLTGKLTTKVKLTLAGLVDRAVLEETSSGYRLTDPAFLDVARTMTDPGRK